MTSGWVELIRGAVTLKTAAFVTMRDAKDGFKRGLILITIVSLAVGLIPFGVEVVRGIRPRDLAAERAKAEQEVQEFLKVFPFKPPTQPGVPSIEENIRRGMEIGFAIAALPTPLPRPIASFFEALGPWLSLPFTGAGGWMSYALLVLLVAKLFKGRATIVQMLACTSLYVVPQALNILGTVLGYIPWVGGILGTAVGLAALVWGIAIYVKGVAVANELSGGKALLATILPALIVGLVVLIPVAIAMIAAIIALAGAAASAG
jgi:hypothetical protein